MALTPARRWLLKLCATIFAVAALARLAFGPWLTVDPVGGPWYIAEEPRLGIEAGFTKYLLYRRTHAVRLVKVERSVRGHRFYAPDCLLFDGFRGGAERDIFAVCGARTPLRVTGYGGGSAEYTPEGIAWRVDPNGDREPYPWLTPIDSILAAARRQPSYRSDWWDHTPDRDAGIITVPLPPAP